MPENYIRQILGSDTVDKPFAEKFAQVRANDQGEIIVNLCALVRAVNNAG